MSKKVFITNREPLFYAEAVDGLNSVSFFCGSCFSKKPIASFLDLDNKIMFLKREPDGITMKELSYPKNSWTYGNGKYHVRPNMPNQTELLMPNGKKIIFRNDIYYDLGISGTTIGIFDETEKTARVLMRCYIEKEGRLSIEFAG